MTPPIPHGIRMVDPGAEFIRTLGDGSTAWHVVVSPPSGIEKDLVYVSTARGGVCRRATADEIAELNR